MMRTEFEFIQNIKERYALKAIGDDCAVLPKNSKTDLLITTDMLVEDIDFRLEWTTPEILGHKSLAVSLSDIAAMGGNPTCAMLSIAVPENLWKTDFLDRLYDGWHTLAAEFNVEMVGGDVSKSPDKLVIDSIVMGEVPRGRSFLRSTARAGDAIFVTGSLGGAAGGLRLLEAGRRLNQNLSEDTQQLFQRQLKPQPQINIGKLLQSFDLRVSMIDVSDGLSSDLTHLCRASGVGATIYAGSIPIDDSLASHFPTGTCLEMALNGGEDFELLFTANEVEISSVKMRGITRIGEVTANARLIELKQDHSTAILEPKGYRHF